MKAAYFNSHGSPDVLQIGQMPQPVPKAGKVLVRVAAISVNPRDIAIRRGELKWLSGNTFPKLTGADFSGNVVSIGSGVLGITEGDKVFGYIQSVKQGCSAEYIVVSQKWITRKALAITHTQAAAVPCTYLTALQALRNKAGIKPGQRILIYGSSGGVGTAAIQLAKYYGAQVTAVCSARNKEYCIAQGADEVWDYNATDVLKQKSKFDIFFQVYSKEGLLYAKGKKMLTDNGVYLTLIPSPQAMLISLSGSLIGGKKLRPVLVKANNDDLQFIQSLVIEKKLTPHISATFSLENIQEAQKLVETDHAVGKVVVIINDME